MSTVCEFVCTYELHAHRHRLALPSASGFTSAMRRLMMCVCALVCVYVYTYVRVVHPCVLCVHVWDVCFAPLCVVCA